MKLRMWLLLIVLLFPTVYALECGEMVTSSVSMDTALTCPDTALILAQDGISLDCNGISISGNNLGNGVQIEANNIQIKNCDINNFENGIFFKDVSEITIIDSTLNNNNIGIRLTNSKNLTITNNNIIDNTYFGIYSQNSQGIFEPNEFMGSENVFQELSPEEIPEIVEEIPEEILTNEEILEKVIKLEYNLEEIPEELLNERFERYSDFFNYAKIERDIFRTRDGTKVTLTISPNPGIILTDVAIYEMIPKCFAQLIDAIVFEQPPVVLEEDPFVKLVIGDVTAPVKLSYETKNIITEQCEGLFAAIGLGKKIEEIKEEEELVRKGPGAVLAKYWLHAIITLIIIILFAIGVIKLKKRTE